jgi:hypothetical protein
VRSRLLPESVVRDSRAPLAPPRAAAAPASRNEAARLAVTLAALVAVGFFAWRTLQPRVLRAPVAREAPAPAAPVLPAASGAGAPSPPAPAASSGELSSGVESALGRTLPFIDHSRNVTVAPDQGLLVIEYDGAASAPLVSLAGRDLGSAPLAAALPAGRHELMLKRGDSTRVRYFLLRAGETQIIEIHE